ncbi:Phenylalanine aminomutase [Colletotrichum sp. SAR 10_66]|nr:Phenylalanine aminomutase [Colletotrichum sp. SAR 10_66]
MQKTLKTVHDVTKAGPELAIDGEQLDIATVVAVARHGLVPRIKGYPPTKADETTNGAYRNHGSSDIDQRIAQSIKVLDHHIENGWVVYGVNTGFGGSADSRTEQLKKLQISLLQHTQSAVITAADRDDSRTDKDGKSHIIPLAWVKAAMVIRANQNLRGHSAVRIEVIDTLLELLRHDVTPLVPLRGTISASGDLMPLSYIAGTLIGDPNITVRIGFGVSRKNLSARDALKECGIRPVELQPKEGLGLINGTAPSAALASLVIYEANQLAILAQALTAFTSECLRGNVEWANEFIHRIRPHAETKKRTGRGLWQDRYSTRTAPQWIGPYLEDLMLAQRQIEVELNSTSDNPVIDVGPGNDSSDGEVYSGGNFQAVAITSAMDKTRNALQMIGRMLFSQCSELINPATNNGLDPNLVFGDPDQSYTMKGIDVNMSAYMSELASLAHPVSAHVHSAEMHNQGINSLALLTGRRTMEAVDVLSHMCAAHLYVCCQAIDLRDYHERFLSSVVLSKRLDRARLGLDESQLTRLTSGLDESVRVWWFEANKVSHLQRCSVVASKFAAHTLDFMGKEKMHDVSLSGVLDCQREFQESMKMWLLDPFNNPKVNHPGMNNDKTTAHLDGLGAGSAVLYDIVRGRLGVSFHQGLRAKQESTIGVNVSLVYEEIRQGSITPALMGCLGHSAEECPENGMDTPISSHDGVIGTLRMGRGILGMVTEVSRML